MAERSTTAPGLASVPATWGGTLPVVGDHLVVAHAVTFDVDMTFGTSPAATAGPPAMYVYTGGSVVINPGVTLRCNGDWFGNQLASTFHMEPGSTIEFGNTADYEFQQAGHLVIAGTAASPAVMRTAPGGPGHARWMMPGNWFYPHDVTIDYLHMSNMGDATRRGLSLQLNDETTQTAIVRHSIFDDCGQVYLRGSYGTNVAIFEDNRVTSSKADEGVWLEGRAGEPATATRSIQRNAFDNQVHLADLSGFTFRHNLFKEYYFATNSAGLTWTFPPGGFRWNLLRKPAAYDVNVLWVEVQDCYLLEDHAGSPHFLSCISKNPDGQVIRGNIFHFTGTDSQGDVVISGPGDASTGVVPYIIENNIVLKNGAGGNSGTVTLHGHQYNDVQIRHNTLCAGPAACNHVGESYVGHTGMVSQWRSNLGYRSAAPASGGEYLLFNQAGLAGPVDVVTPAGCTHNCAGVGLVAGDSGQGYHNIPLSAGTLGANDLPFGTDPQLTDDTRNLLTWDASKGGAGTVASALTRLAIDPTLIETDLIPWIRAGFAPQNPLLNGAAHDGGTIGAVPYAAATPPLPGKQAWLDRIVELTPGMIAILEPITETTWDANSHINHDGAYGAIQMREFLPDHLALMDTYADHSLRIYRDYYVIAANGTVQGALLFPEGVALSWEQDGDTISRDAVIALRNNGLYTVNGDLTNESGSREAAYTYLSFLEAERLGLVAWDQDRVDDLVGWMLGHVRMWCGDPADWVGAAIGTYNNEPVIQCFMMGITAIALAKHLDYIETEKATTDPRILPALCGLAVRMRERFWEPEYPQFFYQVSLEGTHVQAGQDHTILCNESGNFFGWLYHRTGHDYFATTGDLAWIAGYQSPGFFQPKQLNQLIRWSPLYVNWREAAPLDEGDCYVVDPPTLARSEVNVPSDPFVVVPMTAFTGTITPDDGDAGGTFTPASLTWSGTREPKSFTYTHAAIGTYPITCTNDGTLPDPAPCSWTVGTPPEPVPGTRILHKRSAVPGKVPAPEQLMHGELALNTADGLLFTLLEDGTVTELGGGAEVDTSGLVTLDTVQTITGLKTFQAATAATTGLVVQGTASQAANIQEWRDAAGTVLASLNADGTKFQLPDRIAIGDTSTATGSGSIALGKFAWTPANNSVALGVQSEASGSAAVAIGFLARASGPSSIAIGVTAATTHLGSTVIGGGLVLGPHEVALGSSQGLGVAPSLRLAGVTSTTPRSLCHVKTTLLDPTDATYTTRVTFSANDWDSTNTGREGLRIEADGIAARIGFYGVNAVPRAAAPTTLEDVIALLRALGLCL